MESVRKIRARLGVKNSKRGFALPFIIFFTDAIGYAVCLTLTLMSDPLYLKFLFASGTGFFIAALFTVGHDACHQSFASSKLANAIIGRIAFLPSLMPFTCWKYTHNYLHHSFTNLAPKDFVWRPVSFEQYSSFPRWRKVLERAYKHPLGLPLNWIFDNWLFRQFLPAVNIREKMINWRGRRRDQFLVYSFLFLQLVLIAVYSGIQKGVLSTVVNLFFGILYPFVYWSTLISLVDLLHHTHPTIPWFNKKFEWTFYQAQIKGTTHIRMPFVLRMLFHNIMEHTAHHVEPRVPMYHLADAQNSLEDHCPDEVVVEEFSLRGLMQIYRKCKLYDYSGHRWLDFSGNPTTERLFPKRVADQHFGDALK